MYLKILKDVTSAALPSRTKRGTHEMSKTLEVNGAATDASASDSAIPEEKVKIAFLKVQYKINLRAGRIFAALEIFH